MEIEKPGTASNPDSQSDSRSKRDDTRKKKRASGFEFCEVCKLNHDQGQRHKYFPSHKKSLSTVFSKSQAKLSDVRFFLRNPSSLRPEHAPRSRLWCIFCGCDVDELGSSFACENAINHLASADHLKNLKHFLWKYGGGTDLVDKFRITDVEFSKWEKKCKSLENEVARSSKASGGPFVGPTNDIHNEADYINSSGFVDSSNVHFVDSRISNGVVPLQYSTNEYQVSSLGLVEVANSGLRLENATSSFLFETCSGTSSINMNGVTGPQNLTRNFASVVASGNVHTGAPPPWLQAHEVNQLNVGLQTRLDSFIFEPNKSEKPKKLNPKRVGAAWAERRKMEMELEKRGELVKSEFDANWLPNFGRVWQSGTRKESRKEFESGKQSLPKVETLPSEPVKIQPYVSKQSLSKVETLRLESADIQPYVNEQSLPKVETLPPGTVNIQPYISKRSLTKVETPLSESVNTQPYISDQSLPKVENSPPEPVTIQPYVSKRMLRDASK